MKNERRLLPRVALKIHRSLAREEDVSILPRFPETHWQQCSETAQKILTAKSRGWFYALEKLERIWGQQIARFQGAITARADLFLETIRPREITSFREIYRDLVALDDEFDEVDYDLKGRTISVNTGPIVLEDLHLGPFQIRLNWSDQDSSSAYTVSALEPNCAAVNGETVHPHVENDNLCEGDGSEKIAASLKYGCLFEFFILVRQVLETYNDSNAYVSLSNWDGTHCPDCDDIVNDDNLTSCEECREYVCLDCARFCWICSDSSCSECALYCADCSSPACPSCRRFCDGCDDLFCKECLNEELCRECQEKREEETEKEKPTKPDDEAKDANAPLQPLCLGEVTLLPG